MLHQQNNAYDINRNPGSCSEQRILKLVRVFTVSSSTSSFFFLVVDIFYDRRYKRRKYTPRVTGFNICKSVTTSLVTRNISIRFLSRPNNHSRTHRGSNISAAQQWNWSRCPHRLSRSGVGRVRFRVFKQSFSPHLSRGSYLRCQSVMECAAKQCSSLF